MEKKKPLTQLRGIRLEKLEKLQEKKINAYPSQSRRDDTVVQALKSLGRETAIAGRVIAWRGHGKMQFADIRDESGRMQVVFKVDVLDKDKFEMLGLFDIGDFLAVQGEVFKTKAGEISVLVKDLQLLSKSLRPLPSKWHGLKNKEECYRYRYLDFLFNKKAKEKIETRAKALKAIREFLGKEGFIEIETPILETQASGAIAKPFTTHINAYDLNLYLRVCMGELWQKRLIIGGFEKTFELGKAFRNEGVSKQHNPEFTMLEYYWAYADYKMNMALQEKLIAYVVKNSVGRLPIKYQREEIDFTPPYPRRKFREVIREETGLDIDKYKSKESLIKAVKKHHLKLDQRWGWTHIVDEFYKQHIRPKMKGPMFLTHHPADLKPLAKRDSDDSEYTESFQLIVNGFELSNNYSELNDPIDQGKRFAEQKKLDKAGDDETMAEDDEFIESLEYGMPPTTGAGIGIDRLVAVLTDSHSLREVIAFPLMKPKK